MERCNYKHFKRNKKDFYEEAIGEIKAAVKAKLLFWNNIQVKKLKSH
jgi:hypothetical protein